MFHRCSVIEIKEYSALNMVIQSEYKTDLENVRVIKLSCFKFSRKNIFVVEDTHENFSTVLRSHI